ncbi:MAG: calcium-binding protein [Sphingobium sp.]
MFHITHRDGASDIDGGAGFDILNVDYSAYPALYPIGVALKPDQITFNTKYNVFTSYFSNIEHINIKHYWGGVSVSSILINATVDGSGRASVLLNVSDETAGRIFTYDRDGINKIGNVTFYNTGGLSLRGGSGNDVFSDDPESRGGATFYGGGGNDILRGSNLYGEDGDDILYGGSGGTMFGGAGNDVLHITQGANYLLTVSGGAGDDVFIVEGEAGEDFWIEFEDDAGIDEVRTSLTSYELPLWGDIEILTGTSDAGQTLTGSIGRNVIRGGAGDDRLYGRSGDDTIDGGLGNDMLDGGHGVDSVIYEHAVAGVVVSLQAGTASGAAGRDLLTGFENVRGSAFDDVLTGDDGANVLTGLSGADVIRGLAGDDLIDGGPGDDHLDGGDGFDVVNYELAGAGVVVSLATGVASGGAGNDLLSGFENIRGSAFDDVLTGDNGANVLTGLGGADALIGLGGNDDYWIDNVGDTIVEAAGGGYDRVFAKVDYTLADNVEALTLLGRGNIDATGNNSDNVLTGNSGDNRFIGRGGEDVMIGGAGDDIYHVNSKGDQVVEGAKGGIDLMISSISIKLAVLSEIENVRLVGSRDLSLTGSALDNELSGNAGDNIIRGRDGNDVLTGGAGSDRFVFDTWSSYYNVDRITDFVVGEDSIWLARTVFRGTKGALPADAFVVGSAAVDASDRIIYDSTSGALFFDEDGSGSGGAVQFATLTPGLALSAADFLIV